METSCSLSIKPCTKCSEKYAVAVERHKRRRSVAPNETRSIGQVINMHQCSQVAEKSNTKKQPQKKNDRYSLRIQRPPPTFGEIQEKLELFRKVDPPAIQKQKKQIKPWNTVVNKSMSMSSKLQNTPPDNTNTNLIPNTLVILPALDYKIVEDMKKTRANISLFELAKIQSERDILLRALGQTSTDSTASTNKGASTSVVSLTIVLSTLQMEEENYVCPPFLLSFESFNYNVHKFLVDSSTSNNVMPLSIAKNINAQWRKTSV